MERIPLNDEEVRKFMLWSGMILPVAGIFSGSATLTLIGVIVPPAVVFHRRLIVYTRWLMRNILPRPV